MRDSFKTSGKKFQDLIEEFRGRAVALLRASKILFGEMVVESHDWPSQAASNSLPRVTSKSPPSEQSAILRAEAQKAVKRPPLSYDPLPKSI